MLVPGGGYSPPLTPRRTVSGMCVPPIRLGDRFSKLPIIPRILRSPADYSAGASVDKIKTVTPAPGRAAGGEFQGCQNIVARQVGWTPGGVPRSVCQRETDLRPWEASFDALSSGRMVTTVCKIVDAPKGHRAFAPRTFLRRRGCKYVLAPRVFTPNTFGPHADQHPKALLRLPGGHLLGATHASGKEGRAVGRRRRCAFALCFLVPLPS